MLLDVLTRVAQDTGLHPTQQRDKIVRLLQNAADEIYQELDCNAIRREITCLVGSNKLVALPSIVGELKGTRRHSDERIVPLVAMSPRYVADTTGYKYNNWRDLGNSPVHTTPNTIDALTFETALVENAVVTITGRTSVAAKEVEAVTVDAVSVTSTKLFAPEIFSISSNSVRNADITIKDGTGTEIAVLYNNEKCTQYKLIDVSELFCGSDSSDGQTLVDILYKQPLQILTDDTDVFPAGNTYDNAWHARAMSLHYGPMAGRLNDANRYRMTSLILLRNIKDGVEQGVGKKIEFGRNKYYGNNHSYNDEFFGIGYSANLWR